MPKSLHPWSVQFHADTVVHIVSNSWNCCCKDRCCLFIYFGSREQVNDIILGCKTTCKISKVLGKDDQGKPIHGRAKFPQLKTPSDAVKRVTDFVTESTARQLNATPAQHTGSGGDGGSHRVFRCTAGIGCVQESHRGKGHCGPALTRQPARAGALLHCSGLKVASCFARECFLRLPCAVHRSFSPTDALFPVLGLIPVGWRHTAGIGCVQGNYRLRERALRARSHPCGSVAALLGHLALQGIFADSVFFPT